MSSPSKPTGRPVISSLSSLDLAEAVRLVEWAKACGWITYKPREDQLVPEQDLRHYRVKLRQWKKRNDRMPVVP